MLKHVLAVGRRRDRGMSLERLFGVSPSKRSLCTLSGGWKPPVGIRADPVTNRRSASASPQLIFPTAALKAASVAELTSVEEMSVPGCSKLRAARMASGVTTNSPLTRSWTSVGEKTDKSTAERNSPRQRATLSIGALLQPMIALMEASAVEYGVGPIGTWAGRDR